jgi:hypothetical protein
LDQKALFEITTYRKRRQKKKWKTWKLNNKGEMKEGR